MTLVVNCMGVEPLDFYRIQENEGRSTDSGHLTDWHTQQDNPLQKNLDSFVPYMPYVLGT